MTIHLLKEITRLKKLILQLAAMAEEATSKAVSAVIHSDIELAQEVRRNDRELDLLELEIEEECLKILALHQPVAIDLRYVVSCLKINSDLERIGDLAASIAKHTQHASKYTVDMPVDFRPMMDKTKAMLKSALDSLINMDADLAVTVLKADDEVDELNAQMIKDLTSKIKVDPKHASFYIDFLTVSRSVERIADYATNIAEDVIYMIKGEIIRHGEFS